jgi:hypothetical protein
MTTPSSRKTQREHDLALPAAGGYTGWWNENGHPAAWPEDFPDTPEDADTDWRPDTNPTPELAPGEQPF